MTHPTQLPLAIETPSLQSLDNFCWVGNEILQAQVKLTFVCQPELAERFFYIWGVPGAGKTHLLQAMTQYAGASAIYLPLDQVKDYGQAVFDGVEDLDAICLDNIEVIAGHSQIEEALFHLYNKVRDNGHTKLFISGSNPQAKLPIQLPDLRSRIGWGLIFQLQELGEEQKLQVIEQQAKTKGFSLPPLVGQYLINHCARDMHQLSELIDVLDRASLAAKRKLSIPFVKATLNL